MTTPVIIDTDPGIDDAMAILYAVADPAIELVGLTTVFGNVPGATATRNALALLDLAGSGAPVADGAAVPLVQAPQDHPDFVHGTDGLGGIPLPPPSRAVDPRPAHVFLAEEIAKRPGEITLIPVGPLTNIARALDHAPEIAKQVKQVIVMGGAVRTKGNVNDHAEANIWQDPHAAAAVFAADWPMMLVGLDVTEATICTAADLAPMTGPSPESGAFLTRAAEFYFRFHKDSAGIDGCHMHDPSAVIAAVEPGLFGTVSAPLTVTLDGERAGMTREGGGGRAVDICIGVESARVMDRFRTHLSSGRLP